MITKASSPASQNEELLKYDLIYGRSAESMDKRSLLRTASSIAKKIIPSDIKGIFRQLILSPTRHPKSDPLAALTFPPNSNIREDIEDRLGYCGDLLDLYTGELKSSVHKWHHYLPLYERYFQQYRGTSFKFLELGVSKGGSLQMWR